MHAKINAPNAEIKTAPAAASFIILILLSYPGDTKFDRYSRAEFIISNDAVILIAIINIAHSVLFTEKTNPAIITKTAETV